MSLIYLQFISETSSNIFISFEIHNARLSYSLNEPTTRDVIHLSVT